METRDYDTNDSNHLTSTYQEAFFLHSDETDCNDDRKTCNEPDTTGSILFDCAADGISYRNALLRENLYRSTSELTEVEIVNDSDEATLSLDDDLNQSAEDEEGVECKGAPSRNELEAAENRFRSLDLTLPKSVMRSRSSTIFSVRN